MKKKDLLKGIKAVLFDMDGTLVDSMWMWPQIDKEFLNSRGFEVPADLKDDIDGLSMWDDAIYFKKRFGFKDSEQELIDIWNQMALHHYFLEYLKDRGIKRGLVTSNSLVLCEASLKANRVYDDFDTFVTSEDVKHGKPDPEGYLIAARELGADPSECLVTEDLPAGITAARRAGMRVISVRDKYSEADEPLKKKISDAMISDYRELIL